MTARVIREFGEYGRWGKLMQNDQGEKAFLSRRIRSKHFMRKSQSWGIALEVVQQLKKLNVNDVYLHVQGEGYYHTTLHALELHGLIERYQDYEEQVHLHQSHWEKVADESEAFAF